MVSDARTMNSLVVFRNSQGADARGTLLKLTRTTLIFEVYNPYSIVQLSEVLQDVQIRRGERVVYRGRAVVSNLVNTGLMLIVSASLVDSWLDLSGILADGASVRQEVDQFIDDWHNSSQVRPNYQLVVSRIRSFLTELNRWLEQIDLTLNDRKKSDDVAYDELFDNVSRPVMPQLQELFQNFEEEASRVQDDEVTKHRHFVQNDLHPLMLRSPFVHRSFYKPLGYAGDYEMVNMMLRDPREGPSVYAQLINVLYLSAGPAAAHRNRIDILMDYIRERASIAEKQGTRLRVLNIGCGPAMEIQRLIREERLISCCDFQLLDFNKETLSYTEGKINKLVEDHGVETNIQFIHESVHSLLKRAAKLKNEENSQQYDLVYCAGLFDYLSDKICSRLLRLFYNWLKPKGLMLATNVHPNNPTRYAMEHIAEWYLIYRDEMQMKGLLPEIQNGRVYLDKTGINVFLEIFKSQQ